MGMEPKDRSNMPSNIVEGENNRNDEMMADSLGRLQWTLQLDQRSLKSAGFSLW
jgi:hypothetical protein